MTDWEHAFWEFFADKVMPFLIVAALIGISAGVASCVDRSIPPCRLERPQ